MIAPPSATAYVLFSTMPQDLKQPGNHGNNCNCMDPLQDIRDKQYTSRRLLARAYREIRYRPLCVPSNLMQHTAHVRFTMDLMARDEAIFYKEDGRIIEWPDVIPKCPSEVPSVQDSVNLLNYTNAQSRGKITDEQFVVKDKYGRFYPISELFIARVPSSSCSSCKNLPQSPSPISPQPNDAALQA
ncbi:hypothetical protein GCK72_003249 [Caenorhabditis remanei]|uniref:Uncharacterized protein n=1 Tax=Caenorhabditis remanei TaxID=31234 RepID=A0A6A5HXX7_CAERE|nr:hypothetical protein GCK72_003246 [Caenorhabditis remanei]XP_053592561.1 hypothetical protein GCK72_003249 [Caenorhabditis remanei]KAF1771420.1 hypothetical protein GCK72_003246 [Caenorhabditis remanei]KAF1771423.1 hypothetical protein GCK72_003249 [Caenorhabditis remanei]